MSSQANEEHDSCSENNSLRQNNVPINEKAPYPSISVTKTHSNEQPPWRSEQVLAEKNESGESGMHGSYLDSGKYAFNSSQFSHKGPLHVHNPVLSSLVLSKMAGSSSSTLKGSDSKSSNESTDPESDNDQISNQATVFQSDENLSMILETSNSLIGKRLTVAGLNKLRKRDKLAINTTLDKISNGQNELGDSLSKKIDVIMVKLEKMESNHGSTKSKIDELELDIKMLSDRLHNSSEYLLKSIQEHNDDVRKNVNEFQSSNCLALNKLKNESCDTNSVVKKNMESVAQINCKLLLKFNEFSSKLQSDFYELSQNLSADINDLRQNCTKEYEHLSQELSRLKNNYLCQERFKVGSSDQGSHEHVADSNLDTLGGITNFVDDAQSTLSIEVESVPHSLIVKPQRNIHPQIHGRNNEITVDSFSSQAHSFHVPHSSSSASEARRPQLRHNTSDTGDSFGESMMLKESVEYHAPNKNLRHKGLRQTPNTYHAHRNSSPRNYPKSYILNCNGGNQGRPSSDSDASTYSIISNKENVHLKHNSNIKNCRSRRQTLKLPDYDGSYDAGIFLTQLRKTANLNDWNEDETCAHLLTALKGQAREILACLPSNEALTSSRISKSLNAKFGRKVQADIARSKLCDLRQNKGQSLRQLGFEVEKLVGQAYGQIEGQTKESLSIDAFLQSTWDTEVKLQVRLARPKTLDEAINFAESVESAVRQSRNSQPRRVNFAVNSVSNSSIAEFSDHDVKARKHSSKDKNVGKDRRTNKADSLRFPQLSPIKKPFSDDDASHSSCCDRSFGDSRRTIQQHKNEYSDCRQFQNTPQQRSYGRQDNFHHQSYNQHRYKGRQFSPSVQDRESNYLRNAGLQKGNEERLGQVGHPQRR